MIIIKTKEQIDGIRKSCKLLAQLFEELKPIMKSGITTKELDKFCVAYMKKHGGKPAWYRENFPGAACISINDEIIHGLPGKRVVKDGDLVSMDIGIDLDGYISDACVTYPVGNVKPENLKLLQVTTECLYKGIEACKAGNRISDISNAVYNHAKAHNYGVVYEYTGHGVGLDVHEEPSIPNYPEKRMFNPRIKPGMVLAIEPMINLGTDNIRHKKDGWTVITADGSVSCHMEHTVAVFEDHTEILSQL